MGCSFNQERGVIFPPTPAIGQPPASATEAGFFFSNHRHLTDKNWYPASDRNRQKPKLVVSYHDRIKMLQVLNYKNVTSVGGENFQPEQTSDFTFVERRVGFTAPAFGGETVAFADFFTGDLAAD